MLKYKFYTEIIFIEVLLKSVPGKCVGVFIFKKYTLSSTH